MNTYIYIKTKTKQKNLTVVLIKVTTETYQIKMISRGIIKIDQISWLAHIFTTTKNTYLYK